MKTNDKTQKWKERHFGMFIHYGLYSIPGGVWKGEKIANGYSEQILSHADIDIEEYEGLKEIFKAEKFDAREIARLAKSAGMTYLVITTKHHDGFCLFQTETTDYNSTRSAGARDLVAELSAACDEEGIGLGLYFSLIDWHCPDALPFSDHNSDLIPEGHHMLNIQQLNELLTQYGPICEMWFDMGKPSYQQSCELAALVHRLQPDAMINGRIWNNQEDFIVLADNEIPDFSMDVPWQTPASIYHETWGYRSWQIREDMDEKIKEQVRNLATISALGGNHLLNIGPRGDGSIVPFERDVLQGIGSWIADNKEAVFDVEPGFWEKEEWGYSTLKENSLYLQIHNIPASGKILLKDLATAPFSAFDLNEKSEFAVIQEEGNFYLSLDGIDHQAILPLIKLSFSKRPQLNQAQQIGAGHAISVEGKKSWIYQGEEYHSCQAAVSSQSWTLVPTETGVLKLNLDCIAGETIEVRVIAAKGQNETIVPLDENMRLNTKLE